MSKLKQASRDRPSKPLSQTSLTLCQIVEMLEDWNNASSPQGIGAVIEPSYLKYTQGCINRGTTKQKHNNHRDLWSLCRLFLGPSGHCPPNAIIDFSTCSFYKATATHCLSTFGDYRTAFWITGR
eukprot:5769235-Amphidinium_carterae.1